jgi:hypothetical protein
MSMTSSEAIVPRAVATLASIVTALALHNMVLSVLRHRVHILVLVAPCERLTNSAQFCLPSIQLDIMTPPHERGILRPTGWHSSILNPRGNLVI